jgi:hypothetical protein
MLENNTFRGCEPSWANACVGNNGMPDYYDYAQGYSEGSRILINAALENNGCNHAVDIMIYPICFNMRHSVELRLKGAVAALTKIAAPRTQFPSFNLEGSHDIGKIWEFLKVEGAAFDSRLEFYNRVLDGFMLDIAEIDATGQTFRYPYSTDDIKHLVGIPTINLVLLATRFAALEHLLDSFQAFLVELDFEYQLKIYTKNLSRSQILRIAMDTPAVSEWGSEGFSAFKTLIKAKYSIGSKEFSQVMCTIRGLYTPYANFLDGPPLIFLTEPQLESFFSTWLMINAAPKPIPSEAPDAVSNNKNLMRERLAYALDQDIKIKDAWASLEATFDTDTIADLSALYETGSSAYAEHYPLHVEYYQNEFKAGIHSYAGEAKESITRLLKKPTALSRILRTLYLLGRDDLAERLIDRYSIEESIDWLSSARQHSLFAEPCDKIIKGCFEFYKSLDPMVLMKM